MVRVKLMVSDVDGTLVDKNKRLTEGTIAAVRRLEAAGVPFTIISARPRSGMMPILDALGLDGEVGAFNGATIFRRDGTVVSRVTIDAEAARGVMAMAKDVAADRWVFADDRWYASDCDGPHTKSERITSDQEPVALGEEDALLDRADKITFVSDDEAVLRAFAEKAKAAFGDKATIVQSQTYYLDVTPLAGNKGDGIVALAKAYGVPLADTAAIGDQANDLPMLARAGLAIAMGNAPDAVQQAAGHVTRANDADGVAHAIDTLILTTDTGVPA